MTNLTSYTNDIYYNLQKHVFSFLFEANHEGFVLENHTYQCSFKVIYTRSYFSCEIVILSHNLFLNNEHKVQCTFEYQKLYQSFNALHKICYDIANEMAQLTIMNDVITDVDIEDILHLLTEIE